MAGDVRNDREPFRLRAPVTRHPKRHGAAAGGRLFDGAGHCAFALGAFTSLARLRGREWLSRSPTSALLPVSFFGWEGSLK